MPQITYTGTFKVIQQIVDWINNFTPSIGGLDDLTDVDISSPQNDDVLKYNSTTQKWENGAGGGSSGGHTIVDPNGTSMPQENKLQFTGAVSVSDDSTNGQTVVNVSGGGGSSTLAGLTDVTLNSPNDSEVLFYDAATSKWINGTIASLPKIYSATEREVGCWTDGKPIYQKTVHISALPGSTQIGQYIDYPHNIVDLDTICGFEGVLHFSNGNALSPVRVGFNSAGFNYQISIDSYITPSAVRIEVGQDRSNVSADYTIWYTKTTDTPGSGRVTPLATPTVHYSETEEVVGTWIDGKPIYQKTVKFLSQALAAGDNDLNLGIPTIDTVVDSKAMITNSAHTTYRPLNTWTSGSESQVFYLIEPSSGKLRIHAEGSWPSPNIFITLQYTKITS